MTNHGGKREGAGRKPRPYPEQILKLRATPEELAEIQRLDTRERTLALLERSAKMGRVAELNWMQELAENIRQNLGEGSPEELVEYALSDEGRESWGIEIPEWFDGHDREVLTDMVAGQL